MWAAMTGDGMGCMQASRQYRSIPHPPTPTIHPTHPHTPHTRTLPPNPPQVQYGYVNLEEIFRDSTGMSAGDLTALLTAKIVATSVCVGGGLVGGLFAPSLFLGALVGDIMGHFVAEPWGLPDPTSLVVVGAAAVLGAACRAPLTAIALMVEITRDTGLLVPLLAAIGVSSLFTDYLEGIFSKRLEQVWGGVGLCLGRGRGGYAPEPNEIGAFGTERLGGTWRWKGVGIGLPR